MKQELQKKVAAYSSEQEKINQELYQKVIPRNSSNTPRPTSDGKKLIRGIRRFGTIEPFNNSIAKY